MVDNPITVAGDIGYMMLILATIAVCVKHKEITMTTGEGCIVAGLLIAGAILIK
jgi:hypothetical protein